MSHYLKIHGSFHCLLEYYSYYCTTEYCLILQDEQPHHLESWLVPNKVQSTLTPENYSILPKIIICTRVWSAPSHWNAFFFLGGVHISVKGTLHNPGRYRRSRVYYAITQILCSWIIFTLFSQFPWNVWRN